MSESSLLPDEKTCPFCAETIKRAAVKCRYCQSELPLSEELPPPPPEPEPGPTPPPDPDLEPVSEDPGEAEESVGAGGRRAQLLASARLMVGLLVLCLVLAAAAGATWWWGPHQDDRDVETAISSAQARDAGIQQASTLTQKVLSYDWSNLDSDIASTEKVLAPSFRSEYAKTMAGVRDQTVKNQVKLSAKVVASSTVSATPDKVVALIFVNQVTTAKGTTNQRLDQNRVLVTLTRNAGGWRVSKMDAF